MNILALETSSEWCSTALWLEGRIVLREERAGQRHSEIVLVQVQQVLDDARLTLQELDGIAFGSGPGSFTGLRIGCGVAQGLAFASNLPVVGVGSLQCLAESSGAERVIACLDARMGEIYVAAFARGGVEWLTVHAPALARPDEAPAVSGAGWTGVGSGFAVHGAALQRVYGDQLGAVMESVAPKAREVAVLGARRLQAGEGVAAEHAVPLYLRDKVALKVAERMAAPHSIPDRSTRGRADAK